MQKRVLKNKPRNLSEALEGKLTPKEMSHLTKSFDIIGQVVVIDIPEELLKKKNAIGKAILEVHKNVRTVCMRAGTHAGEFRVRPVQVIAGEKSTVTEYKESGAIMRLDVNTVYFTPRLSHERERIAAQVRPNETIAYLFAGVGPFGLVIAKKQPKVKIYAVELNPEGVRWMQENIRINRVAEQMEPVLADARQYAETLAGRCDRVVMPLPKTGDTFLDVAFKCLKKTGGVIHFYHFGPTEKPADEAQALVIAAAKEAKRKIKSIEWRVVRPFSPSVVQVVLDVHVA